MAGMKMKSDVIFGCTKVRRMKTGKIVFVEFDVIADNLILFRNCRSD